MSFNKLHVERIITHWIDGEIEPGELRELQQLLSESPEVRSLYFSYMGVHAELDASIAGREFIARLASDDFPTLATAERKANTNSVLKWQYALAAIAATLLIATGIGILSGVLPGERTGAPSPHAAAQVDGAVIQAEVAEASPECRWYVENSDVAKPESFQSGNVLRVTSGKLQLHYAQGVDVTLHAPAAFQFVSATSGRAILGRLTAHVGEAGKGFAVLTPRAKVIDLGTEFGIDVKDDGATDVVVFKGEVDVDFASGIPGETGQQRLQMGQAVRFDAAGTKSRVISIDSRSYSSALVDGATMRPPVITAVTDNISRNSLLSFYEIVHGGMKEDARAFVDRVAHEYNGVDQKGMPSYLIGGDYVKTFNNDKDFYDTNIRIDVELTVPANLYVLLDLRIEPPQWLKDDFKDTGNLIGVDTGPFYDPSRKIWHNQGPPGVGPGESVEDKLSVWVQKVAKPGTVHLGQLGSVKESALEPNQPRYLLGRNMYGIVAVPLTTAE